jgi:hypothetical protein
VGLEEPLFEIKVAALRSTGGLPACGIVDESGGFFKRFLPLLETPSAVTYNCQDNVGFVAACSLIC